MRARRGFTLIELVVVIVVVAILGGVAFAGIQRTVASSRQAAARQQAATVTKLVRATAGPGSAFTAATLTAADTDMPAGMTRVGPHAIPAPGQVSVAYDATSVAAVTATASGAWCASVLRTSPQTDSAWCVDRGVDATWALSAPAGAAPPAAPTAVTATPASGQVTVAWTGTAASFEVLSLPSTVVCTSSTSPCVVTGLTNGVGYTFAVVAVTGGVRSARSAAVFAVPGSAAAADMIANAAPFTLFDGLSATGSVSNAGATLEAGEPNSHPTSWYRLDNPTSEPLTVILTKFSVGPTANVFDSYTGTMASLRALAFAGTVEFVVRPGQSVWVAWQNATTWSLTASANRVWGDDIGGGMQTLDLTAMSTVTLNVNVVGASRQPGEPSSVSTSTRWYRVVNPDPSSARQVTITRISGPGGDTEVFDSFNGTMASLRQIGASVYTIMFVVAPGSQAWIRYQTNETSRIESTPIGEFGDMIASPVVVPVTSGMNQSFAGIAEGSTLEPGESASFPRSRWWRFENTSGSSRALTVTRTTGGGSGGASFYTGYTGTFASMTWRGEVLNLNSTFAWTIPSGQSLWLQVSRSINFTVTAT